MQPNPQNSLFMHKDLSDLTRSVLYEEIPNQNLMKLTILIIALATAFFILWTGFTNVNEIARTQGEIIPNGYSQIVQHLEGGIVSEILIEEGELVEEGQILIRISAEGIEHDFTSLLQQQKSLLLQAERMMAIANNLVPNFKKIPDATKTEINEQTLLFTSAIQTFESEKEVLKNQLLQKESALNQLKTQQETQQKEREAAEEILNMKSSLLNKGSVSKKDIIDSQRDVRNISGEIQTTQNQILESQQAINEYTHRIQTLEIKFKDTALKTHEELQAQISKNHEILQKYENRVNRMSVRAPTRGLIKGLKINTIGSIISPGEKIMEIVPMNSTLIVETQIPPRDIGSLKIGQKAYVKVSAFDFSRYGTIEGELEFLSATTFVDENNKSFYKGRIKLKKNHVGNNPEKNLILPGMTVEADIITGKKTILSYLLKPIHTSLNSALNER